MNICRPDETLIQNVCYDINNDNGQIKHTYIYMSDQ